MISGLRCLIAMSAISAVLLAPVSLRAADEPKVSGRINALVEDYLKCKAKVGVSVVDLATGNAVAAFNDSELLIPASNQKVVSSALAMAVLGGGFEFTTSIYLSGSDLVVVGDYDPTLGDPSVAQQSGKSIYAEMDKWAAAVKEKVGAKAGGDLLIATSRPKGGYRHADWPKEQFNRWYAAPVAPVNFMNNCLDVTFPAGAGGVTAVVAPASRFITVAGGVSVAKKHLWTLKTSRGESVVTLSGTISKATSEPYSVPVDDPPMLFGRVLADRVIRGGVAFGGQIRAIDQAGFDPSKATLLASTKTPLGAVMSRANKTSLNMAAECLFIRSCGSWEIAARSAQKVLADTYGLKESSVVVADGSGFSRNNRITAGAMSKLLLEILKRKDAKSFFDSLPSNGVDGTLDDRMTDAHHKGRVVAKTGSIAGVSALSGYILDPKGKPVYAFSVLVNGGSGDARGLQDSICRALMDSLK